MVVSNYYHPIDPDCLAHITEWAKEKRVWRDIQHALLCQLWLDTGFSPEELSNLEWKDVDWINHSVRDVSVRDITVADFEIWRTVVRQIEVKNQLVPQSYIFLLSYDQQFFITRVYPGKMLTPTNVNRIMLDLRTTEDEVYDWIAAKEEEEYLQKKREKEERRKQKQAKQSTTEIPVKQNNFKIKPFPRPQEEKPKEHILTEFAQHELEKIARGNAKKVPPKEVYKASWFFCRECKVYHPIEMLDRTNRWGSEFCRLGRGWRKTKINLPDHYEVSELPLAIRDAYNRTRLFA